MASDFLGSAALAARLIGVKLDQDQLQTYWRYQKLLIEANKKINLTAISEEDVLEAHFIDSLTLFQTGKIGRDAKIADIGAGGGFPGLPLKIAKPHTVLHLIEANAKKAGFLRSACDELGVGGVRIHQMRAEMAGREPELREKMDVVISRAVANLPVLLEYALPLCRPGGWFLAMKGPGARAEVESAATAADELAGRIDSIFEPFGRPEGVGRVIVMVEKTGRVSDRYPRRAGIPTKRPLGG